MKSNKLDEIKYEFTKPQIFWENLLIDFKEFF